MKKIVAVLLILFSTQSIMAQNEPSAQPSNLNFTNVKTYKASMSFSGVNDANGYLVLVSEQSVNFTPTDNVFYLKGQYVGNARVVNAGTGTFTVVRNILQNKSYNIAVFAYNSSGGTINYKNDSPLTGAFTSQMAGYGNYYNSVDFTAANVISQLTNLIQPQLTSNNEPVVPYSQFDETIVANFFETDTVINGVGRKYVNCQYSNEIRLYDGTFQFTTPQPAYSREHRMPKSWYDFTGLGSAITNLPEGADLHSLELVQNDVNTSRSNNPYGEVSGNPWSSSYLEYEIGRDANNMIVASPRVDRKGDCARAMFYIMLAYNGKYGENWGLDNLLADASNQDLQTLINWHYNDLPDDFEKTRNEYVFEAQGNRNPFIDFPQLVDCIDFHNMTKVDDCNVTTGILNQASEFGNYIYPNPCENVLHIQKLKNKDVLGIHIYNVVGAEEFGFALNDDSINVSGLKSGVYVLSIQTTKKTYFSKFVKK